MVRVPYLQHFTGDWLSDTRVSMLTAAARGIWIDVLSALHRSDSCTLIGTPDQLARVLRCLESEMQPALNLFQITRLADIEQRTANGIKLVTITCLDFKAEYDEKNRKATNQKNYRNRQGGNGVIERDSNVTDDNSFDNNELEESLPERNRKVSPSSDSYTDSNTKNGGGSGNPSRTSARGEPPPTAAAVSENFKNRQWSELTAEENAMEFADFLTHLQKLHPAKNVREVSKKLKSKCAEYKITFSLERLKGWVEGESKAVSDAEFLAAIGEDGAKTKTVAEIFNEKHGVKT